MARIAGRTAEDTRRAALAAATVVFASQGYDRASLHRIGREAGLSAAALSYHFGDKAGLYAAVIDGLYAELPALTQALAGRRTLPEVVATLWDFADARREAARLVLRQIVEAGGLGEAFRDRVGPTTDGVAGWFASAFGTSPAAARRAVVALTHLIIRFANQPWQDNALALGTEGPQATRAAILETLIAVAGALMPTADARDAADAQTHTP